MPRLPPLPVREPSPPTRLPFRLRTLGRVRGQPHHTTAGTYHGDAMLTLVRSGTGFYHRRGHVERVSRGMIGLVLPAPEPGLMMADPEDPYDHYYCRFAGHEALRMARRLKAAYDRRRFFAHPRWPEAARLFDSMLALEKVAPSASSDWMSRTEGELACLLSLLLTPAAPEEPRLSEASLRRYFLDHLSEPFDLQTIAEYFGVSRFYLSRRARQLLGESLVSAARRVKLDFSRTLLESTSLELEVSDVALRVGYSDPLYFSKVFRAQVGLSPSHYRARIRGRKDG